MYISISGDPYLDRDCTYMLSAGDWLLDCLHRACHTTCEVAAKCGQRVCLYFPPAQRYGGPEEATAGKFCVRLAKFWIVCQPVELLGYMNDGLMCRWWRRYRALSSNDRPSSQPSKDSCESEPFTRASCSSMTSSENWVCDNAHAPSCNTHQNVCIMCMPDPNTRITLWTLCTCILMSVV